MVDYTKLFNSSAEIAQERADVVQSIFRSVYGWMTVGLAVSGVSAWLTYSTGFYETILKTPLFWVCLIAEFALVIGLSAGIRKLSAGAASLFFLLYSAVNGLTLSSIFIIYTRTSIQSIFFITAAMFGGLAVFGSVTKKDLSGIGSVCGMALWGIVLVLLVNLFFSSARVDWAISLVGIVVFSGLTLWDAQKIRILANLASEQGNSVEIRKASIIGALQLYLDFINLFLMLLRVLGRRK